MDRGMLLFLGCSLTFCSSWLGLVIAPYFQLNAQQPLEVSQAGVTESYPRPLSGSAKAGVEVYKAGGCIYCHSQQIRAETFGNNADIRRGWAVRRTVPRDYMYDSPIMLGTMRTGPDLASVGNVNGTPRWPRDWHHKHLYNPRMMVPGSIMPGFAYLYETRKILGEKSADALELSGEWQPAAGYEVVPTTEAKALVDYLMALDKTTPLPEAYGKQ